MVVVTTLTLSLVSHTSECPIGKALSEPSECPPSPVAPCPVLGKLEEEF